MYTRYINALKGCLLCLLYLSVISNKEHHRAMSLFEAVLLETCLIYPKHRFDICDCVFDLCLKFIKFPFSSEHCVYKMITKPTGLDH